MGMQWERTLQTIDTMKYIRQLDKPYLYLNFTAERGHPLSSDKIISKLELADLKSVH